MPYKLYINGQWRDARAGATRSIANPATSQRVADFAFGDVPDALDAMDAAESALPSWKSQPVYDRAAILLRAAALIRERAADLARLVTGENGKPLSESMAETLGCAGWFEWFAEEAKRNYGRIIPPHTAQKRLHVTQQPVGVVVCVTPWNFPINLLCRKVAPALAVGCTVVCRPATETPLSAMRLFECLHDAGLPEGVANLVTGDGPPLVQAMMNHPACRKLTFTGSTPVGKQLMRQAADRMIRLSLELGGHAPLLVFPDVDIAAATELVVTGKFRNAGQSCIAPSRFYVHESIYQEFRDSVVARTRRVKVGNGLDTTTEMGPLLGSRQLERVAAFVSDAVEKGATVLTGGERLSGPEHANGHFFAPTVMENVSRSMRVMNEEPFGPILPLKPFATEAEAIHEANNTPFGLAAYVLTRDLATSIRVSEALEYGIIGLNDVVPAVPHAPFGGWKESGLAREGGFEGLQAYLETKYISTGL